MSDTERFVEAFAERWRQPDPNRLAEIWHPEGRLLHPGMERPIGPDEIPAYLARVISALPDVKLETRAWAATGDTVFIEWTMTATFQGQPFEWDGADRFTLRGDKAISGVAYFDTLPLRPLADALDSLAETTASSGSVG